MVRQYNDEKLEHEKTRILLQKEHERLRFAMGEIEILKQHLEREKYEHDELVKSSHQRYIGYLHFIQCLKVQYIPYKM